MHYLTLAIGTEDPWSALEESRFQPHPPHAERWDWFRIGGRYDSALRLLPGIILQETRLAELDGEYNYPEKSWRGKVNVACFGYIDWDKMDKEQAEFLESYWRHVMEQFQGDPPAEIFGLLDDASTPEEYVNINMGPPCYAAVFRGDWYALCDPPSLAPSREDKERWRRTWKEIQARARKDDLVWVIDCHV